MKTKNKLGYYNLLSMASLSLKIFSPLVFPFKYRRMQKSQTKLAENQNISARNHESWDMISLIPLKFVFQ